MNILPFIQSAIGVYDVIIFWVSAIIIVTEVRHKHWMNFVLVLPISFCLYIVAQCIFYNIHTEFQIIGVSKCIVDLFGKLPWIIIVVFLLGIGILELKVYIYNRKWIKDHITATSIKEAIDYLPVGICCYEPNGQIILKNYKIEKISRALTGKDLLNAVTFLDELNAESKKTEKGAIIQLENGEVFAVLDRDLSDKDSNLRMISLVDITEQYKNTEILEEKQRLVAKLNEELLSYGKQIIDSITAREILDAKVKIHDELGVNLLASKRYILSGGSENERANIESALRKNLQYLKQEKQSVSSDEYEIIADTSKKLGIKLNLIGNLIDIEPQRHIIVTAIHECVTNTIRHANGDELNIVIEDDANEVRVKITNNGKAPDSEITERGGLLLLRTLVDKYHGTMEIDSMPHFVLRLFLKK